MKTKPSDVAVEAKRVYIPYIDQKYRQFPPTSYLYKEVDCISANSASSSDGSSSKLKVAVIDGDPVDVAIDWYEYGTKAKPTGGLGGLFQPNRIPIVNMANEKRPGGDWESGLMAPEENLCRRSNLARCLTTPSERSHSHTPNYPIPMTGGIYSPHVGKTAHGYSESKVLISCVSRLPVRP